MKAFFIFRDGKLFGNSIGYTTEKGARKALVGCEDWYRELRKYDLGNGLQEVPQESIDMGFYEWADCVNCYLFNREVWSRKIWTPYVKEHYQIIEKEFDIVFKD